jgi:hypothetical protein
LTGRHAYQWNGFDEYYSRNFLHPRANSK